MNTDINMEQLQKDAVEIFNQGFACSESIRKAPYHKARPLNRSCCSPG